MWWRTGVGSGIWIRGRRVVAAASGSESGERGERSGVRVWVGLLRGERETLDSPIVDSSDHIEWGDP